ncbi:MAG: 6-bladed beta-propeller [Bacteroidaceae bacterium]|nr:6-bladed beta-propeller [Bacteroidaceae bacterium]
MKKSFFPILIVVLVSVFSCKNQQDPETVDAKYVIEFDDDHFVDIKDIVYDIQIIELDTAMNSALLDITNLSIIDDTLYCFSSSTGGYINKYTMDGRYLSSIKKIGRSHEEWVKARNLFYNPQDNVFIISDNGSKRALMYKTDGTFVGEHQSSIYDSDDVIYDKGFFYSQSDLGYTNGEILPETDHMLNVYDKNDELVEKYIPTTHIGYQMMENRLTYFSWGESYPLYAPTLYETIYALDSGKIFPYATYKYKGTQEEFYTDEEIKESLKDPYDFLGKKSFYNGSVIESPQYIIRRIGNNKAFDVIYDKNNNKSYTTRFYSSSMGEDAFSEYLIYAHPIYYSNGRYYAWLEHYYIGLPDEYLGDNVPEILKPYIEKVRKGQVNQILVSYKIDIK